MEERTEMTHSRREPERIRAEIEKTRAELGATVSALKERLSPEALKRQFIENIESATIGRAKKMLNVTSDRAKELSSTAVTSLRSNLVTRTILNNPIPAALAGIGIGWLILRGPGRSNGYDEYEAEGDWEGAAETGIGATREKAGQMMEEAKERAGEAMEQAREKAGYFVEQAKEKAGQIRTTTREKAQAWKQGYFDTLQNRPLALIAAALALGIVVGFSIPETRREHALMGETKEKLMNRAKGIAQETIQKAERVVGDREGRA